MAEEQNLDQSIAELRACPSLAERAGQTPP